MGIDIKVNAFEGPLDLLLHLIEKNKVDIYDIPISEITSQYLDYIRSMEEEDLDVLSDFLVMAATLLKIKAKMLLPVNEEEEEEGDPREELVRRLIEYKIYKYASLQLKEREMTAEKSFFRSPDIPPQVLAYREEIDLPFRSSLRGCFPKFLKFAVCDENKLDRDLNPVKPDWRSSRKRSN